MQKYCQIIFVIVIIFCTPYNYAQHSKDSLIFSNDLEFYDGIYISFDSVSKNRPIKHSNLIIDEVKTDGDDIYHHVFSKQDINYMSPTGELRRIPSVNVWGYADHGRLYVRVKNQSVPLNIVGHISQFIMTISYVNSNISYGMNPYNPGFEQPYTLTTTETKQFILDVLSNKYFEFTAENLSKLLIQDEELYQEFTKLKNRKKRKEKFYYLKKFNERNPLYIKK